MKISKNTVIIGGGAWGAAIAHQLRLGAAQIGAAQNSTLLVRASSTVHALEKGHIRQHPEIKGLSGFNATTDLTCLKEAEIVYLVVHQINDFRFFQTRKVGCGIKALSLIHI